MSVSPSKERKGGLLFLRRFLAAPRSVGALFPSSRFLARAVVQAAKDTVEPGDYVLELGAGEGSFTHQLILQGIKEERIICVEVDPILVDHLRQRFPNITVIHGSACYLSSTLPAEAKGKVGAVISGLPLLNMSFAAQQRIVTDCFDILKKGGRFIQFTYGYGSSIKAGCFGLSQQLVKRVLLNAPPAAVFAYGRLEE